MTWTKTDAGRAEMQARSVVKERSRRNLLLLVDGARTEAMLLEQVAGITGEDFRALEALGLIVAGESRSRAPPPEAQPTVPMDIEPPPAAPVPEPESSAVDDYIRFTGTLNRLIGQQLGLRGFTLTLAVEKASTPRELLDVADRVIGSIRERKGEEAAEAARAALFGGR